MGQPDVAAHRFQQRQAKGIFQLPDLHGHCGLGHKQTLSGLGHGALARHLQKSLELLQGVGAHTR
jgi:hypothetical protein